MTIRLILVDDQEMVRMGMSMALGAIDDLEVVGEASNGVEALKAVREIPADVVVMDIRMPLMDGVEATKRITQMNPDDADKAASKSIPKILVLTTFDTDEFALQALQAGASGFLLKNGPLAELVSAIRHVHAGDAVIAPSTTKRLLGYIDAPRRRKAPEPRLDELTEREMDVLLLLAQGMSNAEIAEHLVLAPGTVKIHVAHILEKLQVRDRLQAVIVAYQSGIV